MDIFQIRRDFRVKGQSEYNRTKLWNIKPKNQNSKNTSDETNIFLNENTQKIST